MAMVRCDSPNDGQTRNFARAHRTATNPPINKTPPSGIQLAPTASSASLPIDAIDFLHDPLSPLNSRCNQGLRPRAWLRIEEIFRSLQMAGHQDSRHDRDHSFASLVHRGSVSYSLFLRYSELGFQSQDTRTRYVVHSRPGCRSARKYRPGLTLLTSTSARRLTT